MQLQNKATIVASEIHLVGYRYQYKYLDIPGPVRPCCLPTDTPRISSFCLLGYLHSPRDSRLNPRSCTWQLFVSLRSSRALRCTLKQYLDIFSKLWAMCRGRRQRMYESDDVLSIIIIINNISKTLGRKPWKHETLSVQPNEQFCSSM